MTDVYINEDKPHTRTWYRRYNQPESWFSYNEHTTMSGVRHEPKKHPGPDIGHNWYLYKKTYGAMNPAVLTDRFNSDSLQGLYGFMVGVTYWDPIPSLGISQLDALGATAVSRVKPTNPSVDMATFIGELFAGVPKLLGHALKDGVKPLLGKSADEYLNVEFGWLPLVAELQDLCKTLINMQSILDQYRRDAGRQVRRRYVWAPVNERREITGGGFFDPSSFNANASFRLVEHKATNYWFSGAFTYALPVSDSKYGKLKLYESYAHKLLGLRLTPEVLWELAPWSWLIDWFTNLGDVVSNASSFNNDGLVMPYGYVMANTSLDRQLIGRPSGSTWIWDAPYSYYHVRYETKQRRKANPYGFGIDDVVLSLRQQAILAALGLSKGLRSRVD